MLNINKILVIFAVFNIFFLRGVCAADKSLSDSIKEYETDVSNIYDFMKNNKIAEAKSDDINSKTDAILAGINKIKGDSQNLCSDTVISDTTKPAEDSLKNKPEAISSIDFAVSDLCDEKNKQDATNLWKLQNGNCQCTGILFNNKCIENSEQNKCISAGYSWISNNHCECGAKSGKKWDAEKCIDDPEAKSCLNTGGNWTEYTKICNCTADYSLVGINCEKKTVSASLPVSKPKPILEAPKPTPVPAPTQAELDCAAKNKQDGTTLWKVQNKICQCSGVVIANSCKTVQSAKAYCSSTDINSELSTGDKSSFCICKTGFEKNSSGKCDAIPSIKDYKELAKSLGFNTVETYKNCKSYTLRRQVTNEYASGVTNCYCDNKYITIYADDMKYCFTVDEICKVEKNKSNTKVLVHLDSDPRILNCQTLRY